MFSKLMPREGRFFDLFNAHAAQIVEGSHALVQLVADPAASAAHAERIDTAERGADKITLPREQVIGALKRDVLTIRAAFQQSGTGLIL